MVAVEMTRRCLHVFLKWLNGLVNDVCRFEEWICGKSPLNLSFWFNGVLFSCSLDKRFFGAKSARIAGCFFLT